MTSTASTPAVHRPLTSTNRNGLYLAAALGVLDVVSLFLAPSPSDTQDGPPLGIVILGLILGVLTIGFVVQALRTHSRGLVRAVAGTRILSAITGLPAFFVDVEAAVKVLVAVAVLLTVASVVMMFRPSGERTPVVD